MPDDTTIAPDRLDDLRQIMQQFHEHVQDEYMRAVTTQKIREYSLKQIRPEIERLDWNMSEPMPEVVQRLTHLHIALIQDQPQLDKLEEIFYHTTGHGSIETPEYVEMFWPWLNTRPADRARFHANRYSLVSISEVLNDEDWPAIMDDAA